MADVEVTLTSAGRLAQTARDQHRVPRPEEAWIRRQVPELRIIDTDLAARVDARIVDRRTRYFASLKGERTPRRPPQQRAQGVRGTYLLSGGMLICPTCKGHFEAFKSPWKQEAVYVCATRRRKPGVCPNTLTLPVTDTDEIILTFVEGEVLAPKFIEELLALVDQGEDDDTVQVVAQRDRLQGEIANLLKLVASGVSPDTIAPEVRKREAEVNQLEARLRTPRPVRPDIDKLREALTLRADEWKMTLRQEPKVGRLILRRLVEPLTLHDESERPEWIKWDASVRTDLLEETYTKRLASPTGTVERCNLAFRGVAA